MSSILVFLLGFFACTLSVTVDTANLQELFSYDSGDAEDDGIDLAGFGIDIYEIEDNSNPLLVLFNDDDADDYVYCLEFIQIDEVTAYRGFEDWDETSPAREVIFDELLASDWNYESTGLSCLDDTADDSCYSFRFSNIGSSSGANYEFFNITGRIQEDSTGASQYVVKFDIDIDGYSWANVNNSLVVTLVLSDCSEEFEDVDSSDEDTEGSDEDTEGSDEDTEEEDDEDTAEEDDDEDEVEDLKLVVKKQSRLYGVKKHSIRWKGAKRNAKRQLQDEEDTEEEDTEEDDDEEESEDEESDESDADESSGAGISSDDSHEVDLNHAFFRIQPTGVSCDVNMTDYPVNVSIAVDPSTDYDDISIELNIDYFGDCFDYDPEVGEDASKMETGNAFSLNYVKITIVTLISFVVFIFF